MRVFRAKRRKGGKVVVSKYYSGSYRMPWMATKTTVGLRTTDKVVAERRLRDFCQVQEKQREGLPVPSSLWGAPSRSVRDMLVQYEEHLLSLERDPVHVHDTVTRIARLADDMGWADVEQITAAGFVKWRSSKPCKLGTKRVLSVKTVNEYLVSATAFLNWMKQLGFITENALENVQKGETRGHEKKKRRFWTDEEFERFMEAGAPPRRVDYRPAVWILRWTGLRINELQTLRWGDVVLDAEQPYLIVRAEISKSKLEEQVRLIRKAVNRLLEMRPEGALPEDRVIPYALPKATQLQRDLKRAGIVYSNEFGDLDFHSLRLTFGQWLAEQGVPMAIIQQILRHRSLATTQRHYVKPQAIKHSKSVDEIFEADSDTPVCTPEPDFGGQNESRPVTIGHENERLEAIEGKLDRLVSALVSGGYEKGKNGGGNWIRTSERLPEQIYSLIFAVVYKIFMIFEFG